MNISFTKPWWGKEEIHNVTKSIKTTLGTGDGVYTALLVKKMISMLDVPYVLPVTSCTHGLELILASLDLASHDEVIVPSFTMSSTANAVLAAGARPVFADIEKIRYTIDPEDVKRHITPHTKGIILVHYAGMPCLMEELLQIAKDHHLFIIEDAAHALGATYKGKALGTFGVAGAFSFHGTKNICCGEGGAVVTYDKKLADRMEIYRANGTNRRAFLQGIVDKYTWVGKGTSFFLSDILAAMLVAQLEKVTKINRLRSVIAHLYTQAFAPYQNIIQLPIIPPQTKPNWHIYALTFQEEKHASIFLREMRKKGIQVSMHYVPLHSSPMGKFISGTQCQPLPTTEFIAKTLIRLPMYPGMMKKEVQYCIRTAVSVLKAL